MNITNASGSSVSTLSWLFNKKKSMSALKLYELCNICRKDANHKTAVQVPVLSNLNRLQRALQGLWWLINGLIHS